MDHFNFCVVEHNRALFSVAKVLHIFIMNELCGLAIFLRDSILEVS